MLDLMTGQWAKTAEGLWKSPLVERRLKENVEEFLDNTAKREWWRDETRMPDWTSAQPTVAEQIRGPLTLSRNTEAFFADYGALILHLTRRSWARSRFNARWELEESNHEMHLSTYFIRSGLSTEEEVAADYVGLMDQLVWPAPHPHPLQMTAYPLAQEWATQLVYGEISRIAKAGDDQALLMVMSNLRRDEAAHTGAFASFFKTFRAEEPELMDLVLSDVLDEFHMPLEGLGIIGYDKQARQIQEAGVYTKRGFVEHVANPICKSVGYDSWRSLRQFRQNWEREQELTSNLLTASA